MQLFMIHLSSKFAQKGGIKMANVKTDRKPLFGNSRSHALNATKRKWNVNLQKATILVDGKPTKVRISAKELRTLRKAG